jgi:hypothetical protein
MTTARLLSGSPAIKLTGELIDGFPARVCLDECAVDLGVRVQELHDWAAENHYSGVSDWYVAASFAANTVLRTPKGFRYNGASISVVLQLVMGDRENYEDASRFHDELYQLGAPRGAADQVFWTIARSGSKQVGAERAWLGWAGLRIGGWHAWNSHGERKLDIVPV